LKKAASLRPVSCWLGDQRVGDA